MRNKDTVLLDLYVGGYMFLLSKDGRGTMYRINDAAVDIGTQEGVFRGQFMKGYEHFEDLIEQNDMNWGLTEYLTEQLAKVQKKVNVLSDALSKIRADRNNTITEMMLKQAELEGLEQLYDNLMQKYIAETEETSS